jgi:hypothetical protein
MEQGQWYTPAELQELPSLGTGQADEQVADTGTQRVWWGRTEDSPPVSVETFNTATRMWETAYEGNPRRVRINHDDEVEIEEW